MFSCKQKTLNFTNYHRLERTNIYENIPFLERLARIRGSMSIACKNYWYSHGYVINDIIFWNRYHKKNCLFKRKTHMNNETVSTLFAHACTWHENYGEHKGLWKLYRGKRSSCLENRVFIIIFNNISMRMWV